MVSKVKITSLYLVLAVLVGLSFGAGCALGPGIQTGEASGLEVFTQAWHIIHEDYVDREGLDDGALGRGAIEGMLEALDDPYTSYIDADTYELGMSSLEGKFEGIGAHVGVKEGQLMIIAPIAESPAAVAGIKAGDIIMEIDGRSTEGMSLAKAVLNIRGPQGTPVRLLILHEDETEPVLIEIIRAEIEVPSVRFEMKEGVAYINITQFTETTYGELTPVIQDIAVSQAIGLILDLRNNPGGLLETVVDVAGCFLEDGVVVHVVDNKGGRSTLSVGGKGKTTGLPVVVLVNGYSASGSEVLAGALQDHGRAIVAGTTTFGKGSVNVLHQLKDGSGLYVTTARWLTPDGHLIEGIGLSPDIELELEDEDAVQWAVDYLRR